MIEQVPEQELTKVSAQIEHGLLSSLHAQNEQALNTSFALCKRDEMGHLIGGVTASTSYGWLLIKTLWVDEASRGQGIGECLMQATQDKGLKLGCHGVWLDTSSAPAKAFYTKLGYEVFGEMANGSGQVPVDHKRWFMKRALQR